VTVATWAQIVTKETANCEDTAAKVTNTKFPNRFFFLIRFWFLLSFISVIDWFVYSLRITILKKIQKIG
jgi:hypothetical protein